MDLTWDKSLNTGIVCFDEEHRTILKMLNILRDMLRSNCREEACDYVSKVLIPYLIGHLRHEEEVLLTFGYPEGKAHAKSHAVIEKLFRESLEAIDREGHNHIKHFQAIAIGWLFGHINKTDGKYGRFFQEKGLIEKLNTIEPLRPNTDMLNTMLKV